jgi:hypothetical protein
MLSQANRAILIRLLNSADALSVSSNNRFAISIPQRLKAWRGDSDKTTTPYQAARKSATIRSLCG